jgi:hypothetical protein
MRETPDATAPEDCFGLEPIVLDEILPEYDAARIEHRVIDGAPEYVCDAVLRADFGRVPASLPPAATGGRSCG